VIVALLEAVEVLGLRPATDQDAQDLFGLLALCFADYPGCFIDPHDDLPDLRAPGSSFGGTNESFLGRRGRSRSCVRLRGGELSQGRYGRTASALRPARPARQGPRRIAGSQGRKSRASPWSNAHCPLVRFSFFHSPRGLYQRLGYNRAEEQRELDDISQSVEYRFEKDL
jgi:putative acetyltransferase